MGLVWEFLLPMFPVHPRKRRPPHSMQWFLHYLCKDFVPRNNLYSNQGDLWWASLHNLWYHSLEPELVLWSLRMKTLEILA